MLQEGDESPPVAICVLSRAWRQGRFQGYSQMTNPCTPVLEAYIKRNEV